MENKLEYAITEEETRIADRSVHSRSRPAHRRFR